jgi:hypothetical protein
VTRNKRKENYELQMKLQVITDVLRELRGVQRMELNPRKQLGLFVLNDQIDNLAEAFKSRCSLSQSKDTEMNDLQLEEGDFRTVNFKAQDVSVQITTTDNLAQQLQDMSLDHAIMT